MATTATGKKRMTQSDVINYFAEKTGMKRAQVKQLFEDIANLATSESEIQRRVCASGLWQAGTFLSVRRVRAATPQPAKLSRFRRKRR
jgi:hypothetical protein